ncbi:SDR family NAD(P)-dependent oxidoreductase [Nocardia huaxiensis]|uniref:SDR family oxidoreductase n=1 Tax=Nocardia huaxiensis TaxID=2755382 RepID=A0A7D6Z2N9_9NOCA|nr:SDR family oxidoreductase [Nocardia huaxiensis]QLY31346.1 SDR family oxidoreductase [Nocardia huaxiensis]UFS94888.1 SDR family oxidoreductase [Nocardia huaxiensis]
MTRLALVTGAASGMGRIVAQRLAAAGWEVAAVDLNGDGLGETAKRSPNMHTYTCDVSDPDQVRAVVEKVRSEHGTIDRLVHAAGMAHVHASALDHDVRQIKKMMDVNYIGTVNLCQAIIPTMKKAGTGEVILFASVAGWLPSPGMAGYSASKFAVVGFIDSLAYELKDSGIRLLGLCPPMVETPFLESIRKENESVLGGAGGMSPEGVVDALEKALSKPKNPLFVFPGQAYPTYLMRRFMPGVLRALVARMVKPTD